VSIKGAFFVLNEKALKRKIIRENNVEDCTKKTVIIEGENYYLLVGDDFAMVTVPRENDPMMSTTRMIAETICSEITELMQKRIALQEAPAAAQEETI
jgi:hypothetical protein